MKKRFTLTLMSLMLFMYACTYSGVYINRDNDDAEGRSVVRRFYADVAQKNYRGIDSLVSDSLKQLAGADGVNKIVKFINNKVGNYKSYEIVDRYIRRVTGSNNETSYNYKLKVTYDKGVIDEILGFRKQNGPEIKMNSYHANSDLLMK